MAGLIRSMFGISPAESERSTGAWLLEGEATGQETTAGVSISSHNMVTLSAVFGAVRALSEDVAKLPFKPYRKGEDRGEGLPRGKFEASDDPLYTLVTRRPNVEMTPFDFRQALVASALMWHGGFAEIERNGGRPRQLWPIHPSLVDFRRADDGEVFYRVYADKRRLSNESRDVNRDDMLHVRGFNDTGLVGWMISKVGANAMGVYKAAEDFTGKFFSNGAFTSGILSFDGNVKQETLEDYQRRLDKKYTGVRNMFRMMLFGGGAKFTPVSADAEKSQLTETLQFRIEDIARWFRMPPHKIQHLRQATFSNIEQQSLEYVTDTLMPWLVRVEQEHNAKLIDEGNGDLFFEHTTNALLRGDMASRSQFYNAGIQGGWMTRNEVRDAENKNPYPGGDAFLIQQNMAVLDDEGNPVPANSGEGDSSEENVTPPQPETPSDQDVAAWMPVVYDAFNRMVKREVNAITKRKGEVTEEWIDRFYAKHEADVIEALEPCLQSIQSATQRQIDRLLAARHAAAHVAESRSMLSDAQSTEQVCDKWQHYRAAESAERLLNEVYHVEPQPA